MPTTLDATIDVFLQPGELYFGDSGTRIRTVLGSCVSLVFWHPGRRVGGMCHYMLPCRADRGMGELDGRYADEAIAMMLREMRAVGTRVADYETKLFGGANMFPNEGCGSDHVGSRNVRTAREFIQAHGLRCIAEHTAGVGHRSVVFDVGSGNVWVRQQAPLPVARRAAAPVALGSLACAA